MKQLTFLFTMLSAFSFAQTDIEDQTPESTVSLDVARNIMTYEVRGVYQVADKACYADAKNFRSANYLEGEAAFIEVLKKQINRNLNSDTYAADGDFYINLSIDKNGDVIQISIGPNIANTRYFYEDLKSAVEKIKGKWKPATCDGIAIDSQVKIKLLFDSMIVESSIN